MTNDLQQRIAELEQENQRLEARLNETAVEPSRLLEFISDAVIALNTRFEITSWSPGAERIYGWREEEVIGKSMEAVLRPATISGSFAANMFEVVTVGSTQQEYIMQHKSGKALYIYTSSAAIHDGDMLEGVVTIHRDVTARKRAEDDQRRAESLFRALMDATPAATFIVLLDGTRRLLMYANPAAAGLTGYSLEELLSLDARYLFRHDKGVPFWDTLTNLSMGRERATILTFTNPQGEVRALQASVRGIRYHGLPACLFSGFDITEQVREQQLTAQLSQTAAALNSTLDVEQLLTLVIENASTFVDFDMATLMLREDQSLEVVRAKGWPPQSAVQVGSRLRLPDHPRLMSIFTTKDPLILEDVQTAPNWTPVDDHVHGYLGIPILVKGEVIGLLNLHATTSGRFTPETISQLEPYSNQVALALTNAERYRESRERARIEERTRIARDIHDMVQQTMQAASMIAGYLPETYKANPEMAFEQVELLRDMVRAALKDMRALMLELRPANLIDMPLDEILSQLAESAANRADFQVEFDLAPNIRLPGDVQLVYYRIMQEALNNVIHHAQASVVKLRLHQDGPHVTLYIQDNGKGFDRQKTSPDRFGLQGMAERAATIGADLNLTSAPGDGTTITLTWTYKEGT